MKRKNIFTLLILTFTLGLTTSCGLMGGGDDTSANDSATVIKPVGLQFVTKPETYLYGESIDYAKDFKIKVKYSDGTDKVAVYDSSRDDGWFFASIIDPDARSFINMPSNFNKLGKYTYTISYSENGREINFDKDHSPLSGELFVAGGSHSEIAPERLEVNLIKDKYFVGEVFDLDSVEVRGFWPGFGGYDALDKADYTIKGDGFDITKPLELTKTYNIEISYRGIKKLAPFKVLNVDALEKSTVDYTYNNYDEDNFTLTNYMNTTGNPKTLIVPIWFKDSGNFIKNSQKEGVRELIRIAYLGSEKETGWHSVKTYYEQDSFGQLHIDGVVDDWFYYDEYSYNVKQKMTIELVKLVSNNYKEKLRQQNRLSEWLDLDTDKDGYLDAVILIYGAPNFQNAKSMGIQTNNNLWAYCFWVQDLELEPNTANPVPNAFFWASFDFMLGDQPQGSPIIVDAHTYIHEMGHILGLDDYYDYTGETMPAGLYTMQDANVGGHDPFSRLAYGWIKPYVPKSSCTIKLKPFESSGETVVLCPDWDGSAFNEYIIMDYWTPDGLNELDCTYEYANYGPLGPKTTGLRVWHVDARLARITNQGHEEFYDLNGELTTKCLPGEFVDLQCSNTTYNYADEEAEENDYCADIDELRKYDLLALLNHDESNGRISYQFDKIFSAKHLWQPGDTFSMQEFETSFTNKGKLNSKKDLGFSFEVLSKNESEIVINFTKN